VTEQPPYFEYGVAHQLRIAAGPQGHNGVKKSADCVHDVEALFIDLSKYTVTPVRSLKFALHKVILCLALNVSGADFTRQRKEFLPSHCAVGRET
jgi:hypothetical protein